MIENSSDFCNIQDVDQKKEKRRKKERKEAANYQLKRFFSSPSDLQPCLIAPTASPTRSESPAPTSRRESTTTTAATSTRKAAAATSRRKPATTPRREPTTPSRSESTTAAPGRTTATSGTATTTGGLGAFRTDGLGLGQEPVEREQFVAADVELVALLERGGDDTVLRLDGEVDLVHRAEDLVDFADDGLQLVSV